MRRGRQARRPGVGVGAACVPATLSRGVPKSWTLRTARYRAWFPDRQRVQCMVHGGVLDDHQTQGAWRHTHTRCEGGPWMILTLTRDGVRTVSMIPGWSRRLTMVAAVSAVVATPALGLTKCTMDYSLSGWSVVYSTASGSGTITCDDGASARVGLRAKGGGLT